MKPKNINQAKGLSLKYNIPEEDIILIALNYLGANADIPDKRIRFKLKLHNSKQIFYMAICVNTGRSPFFLENNKLFFDKQPIGEIIDQENDTCDSTYFRRGKTALTLNSNSRSKCQGCKFCGTYNQDAEDIDSLLTEDKLESKLHQLLNKNQIKDMSKITELGICTGCFNSENDVVNHILMARRIARKFGFAGEIKYLGSQLFSKKAIDLLARDATPLGLSLTLECFTRRKELLRPSKAEITVFKAIDILSYARAKGFKVTILYILGLDPLDVFVKELTKLSAHLNRFPVINIFQNYAPQHEFLRVPEAKNIEYYLRARSEVERIFQNSFLKPRLWENYRGLWHLSFKNQPLNEIRI